MHVAPTHTQICGEAQQNMWGKWKQSQLQESTVCNSNRYIDSLISVQIIQVLIL